MDLQKENKCYDDTKFLIGLVYLLGTQ